MTMEANMLRRVPGELRLLQQEDDGMLFRVELWLYNDAVNRNNWQFINLEQHRELWAGRPILVAYARGGRQIGDGHNQREQVDPATGKLWSSFTAADAERIVGAISENPDDVRLEQRDGETWVAAKGFLWTWYAKELVEKIVRDARQGRDMSVSIEALVTKASEENGVEIEEEYVPLGVTILGDHVAPAVEDAHIAMLSQMESEFRELKLRAASFIAQNRKGDENSMFESMSKQEIRTLQERVGAEYKVLSADRDLENEKTYVMLARLSDDAFGVLTVGAHEEEIDLRKLKFQDARIVVQSAGDEILAADAQGYISERCAKAELDAQTAKGEVERLTRELAQVKETMESMVRAESKRRVEAAKKAARDTLEKFNALRPEEDRVDAKCLEDVEKCIDEGEYAECADGEGGWDGEKRVEQAVKALCADAVMQMDAKRFRPESQPITWGRARLAQAAPGTVGEFLAAKYAQQ